MIFVSTLTQSLYFFLLGLHLLSPRLYFQQHFSLTVLVNTIFQFPNDMRQYNTMALYYLISVYYRNSEKLFDGLTSIMYLNYVTKCELSFLIR